MRLTSLNFVQFVLNFALKEHHDDDDGDDVYKQDQPSARRPLVCLLYTSDAADE